MKSLRVLTPHITCYIRYSMPLNPLPCTHTLHRNHGIVLSRSMELLSPPPTHHHSHTSLDGNTARYTRSPSTSLLTPDLSIEGDLMLQLDRRLSFISVSRLQAKLSEAKRNETKQEAVLEFSPPPSNDGGDINLLTASKLVEFSQSNRENTDKFCEGETVDIGCYSYSSSFDVYFDTLEGNYFFKMTIIYKQCTCTCMWWHAARSSGCRK